MKRDGDSYASECIPQDCIGWCCIVPVVPLGSEAQLPYDILPPSRQSRMPPSNRILHFQTRMYHFTLSHFPSLPFPSPSPPLHFPSSPPLPILRNESGGWGAGEGKRGKAYMGIVTSPYCLKGERKDALTWKILRDKGIQAKCTLPILIAYVSGESICNRLILGVWCK